MRLITGMPCRNEEWIAGLAVRAALMWSDMVIVMLHACTDKSEKIISAIQDEVGGDRLIILGEFDPTWAEMSHRQRLLECARHHGATHIGIVDMDEVLTGNLLPTIRPMISAIPPGQILQLPWICLAGGTNRYYSQGVWSEQQVSTAFPDDPAYHWRAREGYDFHHRHPMGLPCNPTRPYPPFQKPPDGGLMHLQFVSGRRLRAKQYHYQLTEKLRWPNREPVDVVRRRYSISVYGQENPTAEIQPTAEVPASWWAPYADLMQYLEPHAEPWQLASCAQIMKENPGIEKGLDDFGLFFEPFYERGNHGRMG
jgi:hypothetical protein